ncbi:hypothetical protein [Streptomyces sp. NPDC002057]|uniref:hypothetical protein n=1 Tax=Streptomyces sp. NPDC002057 TaxID=3154664 RepID=UPI003323DEDB
MSGTFNEGDVVYYDDNRLKILAGPFRTPEYPAIDQYHVSGVGGSISTAWGSDLASEDDYCAFEAACLFEELEAGDWEGGGE